jgi:hypothetical protein
VQVQNLDTPESAINKSVKNEAKIKPKVDHDDRHEEVQPLQGQLVPEQVQRIGTPENEKDCENYEKRLKLYVRIELIEFSFVVFELVVKHFF